MKKVFETGGSPVMIVAKVVTQKPQRIRFKVYPINSKNIAFPNTLFTDRYCTITGEETLYFKIPQTANKNVIEIYNEDMGNASNGQDRTFTVTSLEKKFLPTSLFAFDFTDPITAKFTRFAEEFALKAGYTTPGIYLSDDALFRIDYMNVLTGNGAVVNTPARIGAESAIVEVSKTCFNAMSVPARFLILEHEFSHFYKNSEIRSEEEADKNAISIYLGKGYPSAEALIAYARIFKGADNAANRERFEKLKGYVNSFYATIRKKETN